jgi:hypothetical protein
MLKRIRATILKFSQSTIIQRKKDDFASICPEILPSSKLINSRINIYSLANQDSLIILENRDYMTMLKEKLAEIKQFYKNLNVPLLLDGR